MTIHYHGTPISPRSVLDTLAGRHFCVSFSRPVDVAYVHRIGQSVMLDNGAFSAMTLGSRVKWKSYYRWCDQWLDFATTWAVIPDVIDGDEQANEALIDDWPHGDRGAPVWHMHESVERLVDLSQRFSRVCIGSSRQFADLSTPQWHARMGEAMNRLCGHNSPPPCWLHMLRGMALAGSPYPFASVDSTNIARNHNRAQNTAAKMAALLDAQQCPARWQRRAHQMEFAHGHSAMPLRADGGGALSGE